MSDCVTLGEDVHGHDRPDDAIRALSNHIEDLVVIGDVEVDLS